MLRRFAIKSSALAMLLIGGCTTVPPFVLTSDGSVAPAGPKINSLMVNLKCELWDAANDLVSELQYYLDVPDLQLHTTGPTTAPDRRFTLKNYFQEIEYVADAQWTLDVTGTGALNPLFTYTNPYNLAKGLFPATNVVLSVGGQLSDAGHRYIQIYTSVDFARLVEFTPVDYHYAKAVEPKIARPCPVNYEPNGVELGGQLGLKETLATGITAVSMNDVGLFPSDLSAPASGGPSPTNYLNSNGQYTFGLISAQIDFTIMEGINGGPTWTLRHFKGPGGNSSGLLNFSRQVKDTLLISFVPVCIREKYWEDPSVTSLPKQYYPEPIVGTPGWANYLPPCNAGNLADLKTAALNTARYVNFVNTGLRIPVPLLMSP